MAQGSPMGFTRGEIESFGVLLPLKKIIQALEERLCEGVGHE